MRKWLNYSLNYLFGDEMKMAILSHLEKFQKKDDERWACDMLTIPGMLGYDVPRVRLAIDELVAAGYVRTSSHRMSQFRVTEQGKQLLQEYNRFCQKWLLSKITWYFKDHLDGVGKIVWVFLVTLSVIVTLLTRFDAARSACDELRQFIVGFSHSNVAS